MSVRALALVAFGFGGGAAHAQTAPFTDWASVLKPGATVAVGGVAQEFTYTSGASGVTSVAAPSTNMAATFTETFNATGDITAMAVQNANRSVGFYKANGDSLSFIANDRLIYGLSSDWTRKAIAADPLEMEWKYQSFGAWVSGLGQAQGSMGAASVGAITAGTAVPQTGSASFVGMMGGIYNDAAGQDHLLAADMGLNVDFAGHRADFWTINTSDKDGRRYADLDITGEFVSLPNHPALFGTLATARLTGTSSAQFYGPAAEEVGGVFTMTPKSGQGLERLAGAFGGKRGAPPAKPIKADSTTWGDVWQPGSSFRTQARTTFWETRFGARSNIGWSNETFSATLSATGAPATFAVETANGSRPIFSTANGDSFSASGALLFARSADGARTGFFVDPRQAGWNYQTFGVWETSLGSRGAENNAAMIGTDTAENTIPTSGGATFTGVLGGHYSDGRNANVLIKGDLTAVVDFRGRTLALSTSNLTDREGRDYNFLQMRGTLTVNSQYNAFLGAIHTGTAPDPVQGLVGEAQGKFFGPSANELGGVFAVGSDYGTRRGFSGAFGAKR